MGTKTISISDEAYSLLKHAKEERESFTETILRITRKDPLSALAGVLSSSDAEALERVVRDIRRKTNERVKRIAKRMS
jgi:predicted CopG family antitoxin